MAEANSTAYNSCVDDSVSPICWFRIVMGTYYCSMGLMGFILLGSVIYCISFNVVKLPGGQNRFVLNMMANDVLLAVIAFLRGLGIFDKKYCGVGEDDTLSLFCTMYPLIAKNIIRNSYSLCLVPLTIDRFIAVVFPLKHRMWITTRTSLLMIAVQWMPCVAYTVYNFIAAQQGIYTVLYIPQIHKCLILQKSTIGHLQNILFVYTPAILIILMYCIMIHCIIKNNIQWQKILLTAALITFKTLLTILPNICLSFGVMSLKGHYHGGLIFISLHYISTVFDPVIYFGTNPRIRKVLCDWMHGRKEDNNSTVSAVVNSGRAKYRSKETCVGK